jgi:hypothetical protein
MGVPGWDVLPQSQPGGFNRILDMNPLTETKTPLQQTLEEIGNVSKSALDMLEHAWRRSYELTWNNPHGLTPQQVIDGFGVDAQTVFYTCYLEGENLKAHGRLMEVTNAAPLPYNANPDGSITLQ